MIKTRKLAVILYMIVVKLKKKEGVSSRTISSPIATPPPVLVKIPIDWS